MARDGIVLIDKEEGRTSFETVQKVRRTLQARKAGHAGTLDKAASGLLIVCINRATSLQPLFMSGFKRYRATVHLGEETDTLDRYGKVVQTLPVPSYSGEEINAVLRTYLGKTLQVPPQYSSIHVKGKRSYLRKLHGEEFELQPREIEVRELELLDKTERSITLEILASKGTYVRSLARDISRDLGTCGSILALRRLAIGSFSVDGALRVGELDSENRIIPLGEALAFLPQKCVGEESARKVSRGIPLEKVIAESELDSIGEGYTRILFGRELIALVMKKGGERPAYFKVFGWRDQDHAHL